VGCGGAASHLTIPKLDSIVKNSWLAWLVTTGAQK